jgi:hypothetical protein
MTPDELMRGMSKKNLLLQEKNEELLNLSEKRAQAERAYNTEVAKTTLRLKAYHPATLIPILVKGDVSVAELKYKMDVADGVYRACQESLKDVRTAIDSYRSMLSFEKEELLKSGIS